MECIARIAQTTNFDPLIDGKMHHATATKIISACSGELKPKAAIALEVERQQSKAMVEFQIVDSPASYLIVLGTNCLNSLGLRLYDLFSGYEIAMGPVHSLLTPKSETMEEECII
uniref:Uncharacterized protein n=1 Tax=Acrobeloides nanus TaxID=290746 RepID=A0A914DKV6_9BILA